MATKKTTSTKKSVARKTPAKSKKVTTVKAVSSKKRTDTLFGLKMTRSTKLSTFLAEFVGTFMLAAVVITQQNSPVALLFALIGLVLAVGALSGAHLNPAISIAAWATRKMTSVRALGYVVAQVLGAMLALVVLNGFFSAAPTADPALGQQAASLFQAADIPDGKEWAVLFAELLGATIFGFAFASAMKKRDMLSRGLTVGAGFFTALVVAGSSAAVVGATAILNPASAVALQAVNFDTIWPFAVYVFAAVLGGMIGFVLHDVLAADSDNLEA